MILDHFSLFLFGGNTLLYAFARWGFPCFAFGVAEGARHTSRPGRYLLRMLILGLITQPLFIAVVPLKGWQLNIVFTLLLGAGAVMLWLRGWPVLSLILVACGGFWFDPVVSYGWYGVGLVLAFSLGSRVVFGYFLVTGVYFLMIGDLQFLAIMAWPLIYDFKLPQISIPRWVYYVSYPGHLALIFFIKKMHFLY